ncbi:hypothetical protein CK503_08225 [Aliifodinibius salipaludis]|uniref:DUF4342 domain-containing protein n=1 Tax=Fodinibius salipaludis TaxID=2032627 RepID=A0A2A2GAJ5_9BACT|nr:DUF4342 domain-containing protein [Aliifodinibius salipaludis]PAU94190.1 hypothetical protein CK503_08225 [Aliifodinibius salipaludis]
MNTSNSRKTFTEEIQGTISEIINQVKKLIKEGNARRVIIKNSKDKVLFQSQLTVGVGGAAVLTSIAPVVSAIGMFALFMNDVKIIVERYPEDETEETKDEYEVEAEFIEIRDEEETNTSDKKGESKSEEKTDKTVGKDGET